MINFIKKNKEFIFKAILILLIFIHTNFFLNIYLILQKNYQSRMVSVYGYCDKQGYGFIQKFKNKFLKNE